MKPRYIESKVVQQYRDHDAIAEPATIRHLDVAVATDSDQYNGEQTIHVSVAEVDNADRALIVPVSWSDWGKRPFQEIRLSVMAKYLDIRVIGLDFPGMGDLPGGRRDELTEKQLEEAEKGRLRDLTSNYWQAIQQEQLLSSSSGDKMPVGLWGSSLSTLTVAEMAVSAPEDFQISDIYTSEIMGFERVKKLGFAVRFMTRGAKDLDIYQAMNTAAPEHDSGTMSGLVMQALIQRQGHRAALTALAKGQHKTIVRESFDSGRIDSNTALHIVSAENGLSSPSLVDSFVKTLNSNRPNNPIFEERLIGEFHGYQDSLPAVLDQVSALALYGRYN